MSEQPKKSDDGPKTYFGESNEVDPTPGWIPFFFVIAFVAFFLSAFVVVAVFWR